MKLSSQRGVALVITLIMLSIITFLAVAFLSTTRRDRLSVSNFQSQTVSRIMAETAAARAQSEIIGRMLARANLLSYELMVSRNYINPLGFDPTIPRLDTNNVNYNFVKGFGSPLNHGQFLTNIANLFFDPRPPVFVKISSNLPNDFRYYLDLNRDGRYNTNGYLIAVNRNGVALTNGAGGLLTNFFKGDPEWVGVLAKPEYPHSATNQFTGRWAFIVLPAGNSLDFNYIHNAAADPGVGAINLINPGFRRNQGVGSWELNLAGFLCDLNTNLWPVNQYDYIYPGAASLGNAFSTAARVLDYRNVGRLDHASSASAIFGGTASLLTNNIDAYSDGPFWATLGNTNMSLGGLGDSIYRPWSGSDLPRKLLTLDELFRPGTSLTNLINTVSASVTNRSSYDQYTFYRMLEQISGESSPELKGKLNVNFKNDPAQNHANQGLVNWVPVDFFTNAANLLLNDRFKPLPGSSQPRGPTNLTAIQIYPTNNYTPAVHQLLQVAANFYSATDTNYFPPIFRPCFVKNANNSIWVKTYEEVTDDAPAWQPYLDLTDTNAILSQPMGPGTNIFGIPFVIGAKKGFPNFNEYSVQTLLQMTRKLEFRKNSGQLQPFETNQIYMVGISNRIGIEVWNAYTQAFTRPITIIATNYLGFSVTNETGQLVQRTMSIGAAFTTNQWPGTGYKNGSIPNPAPAGNFILPLFTNVHFLPTSIYRQNGSPGFTTNLMAYPLNRGTGFPNPNLHLNITNRLVFAMIITTNGLRRIIDYVNLNATSGGLDLNQQITGGSQFAATVTPALRTLWQTNRLNGSASVQMPTTGIDQQIRISLGSVSVTAAEWRDYNSQVGDKQLAIAGFTTLMTTVTTNATNFYAPFVPTVTVMETKTWQANDPLVHHLAADLIDPRLTNSIEYPVLSAAGRDFFATSQYYNLGKLNSTRYAPWNTGDPATLVNPAFKDPMVMKADDWEFPTNKLPNIGWLGRIHRGTPWQTVYLKSDVADPATWARDWASTPLTHPTNDWRLLDLFTVAPNDNAARGLLSVNQSGLAAWSAVLSGVVVLSNRPSSTLTDPVVIQPDSPELKTIVNAINQVRLTKPARVFASIGDALAVPELTMKSPFLDRTDPSKIPEAAYERIPQQISSLLQLGNPRFVVYAFGQSLKPAGMNLTAPFFNMVTNYQITGEVATRTVFRVEGTERNPRVVVEKYTVLPGE